MIIMYLLAPIETHRRWIYKDESTPNTKNIAAIDMVTGISDSDQD